MHVSCNTFRARASQLVSVCVYVCVMYFAYALWPPEEDTNKKGRGDEGATMKTVHSQVCAVMVGVLLEQHCWRTGLGELCQPAQFSQLLSQWC